MQAVSQAWKDNQNKTLVGESAIEISLKMTDPDAYEDAVATDDGHVYFANTGYVVSDGIKNIRPYATLEQNLWLLNGSREIVPEGNYGEAGYISTELSSSSTMFRYHPTVTINFSRVHHNPLQGVTIRWSEFLNEYATAFHIIAYQGSTVVASTSVVQNDSVLSVVEFDIVDYDRIEITITQWSLPNRRARISEILIGTMKVFSKADIFSYKASYSVDPISAELPKSEVSFSINNLDDAYNPHNVEGLSKYLIERQEITARYGYKLSNGTTWISGGKFYISEWDAEQNGISADFKARDLLEFMTGTYYRGLYNPTGTSLYDLATDVLIDANLPVNSDGSTKWVIDEKLKDVFTVAPLPIDTHANCLQMIANAGGCVFYQDRNGTLRMGQISYEPIATDYGITYFNSYSKSGLSLSKPLKRVDVPFYSFSVATESSELYKGSMKINGATDIWISYSGSATNVSAQVTGGTLNSATYYTNACVLNITAVGDIEVVLNGYSIQTSSTMISTYSSLTGETVSVDNPLITSQERALVIGSWIEAYMKNRMALSSEWRADPRLDPLDIVTNENDFGENNVMMESVEYSYNGAFRGSGKGRVI